MRRLPDDKPKGRARPRHTPGKMNKTEAAFAEELEISKRVGEVLAYEFEVMKFKIAEERCWWTPDFMVLLATGLIQFVDVKGGGPVEDDALLKIKVAADRYPMFLFAFATKERGGAWVWRQF